MQRNIPLASDQIMKTKQAEMPFFFFSGLGVRQERFLYFSVVLLTEDKAATCFDCPY